jgi:hypothetical protein
VDDKELDDCLTSAELGLPNAEIFAAKALLEMLRRIMQPKAPTEKAARIIVHAIVRTIETQHAAEFLFGKLPKRRGPPRKYPRMHPLMEYMLVGQLLQKGFTALSTERDTRNSSAFTEVARMIGAETDAEINTEAERIRKGWNRLSLSVRGWDKINS